MMLAFISSPVHTNESEVPSEKIQQFVDVYKKIKDQYVDEVDDATLFNYAIDGMVSKLDPYSDYLSKDDFSELRICLLYTSPSPRDRTRSRMPSSA